MPARAFDGRSTHPQAVLLQLAGSTLLVQADASAGAIPNASDTPNASASDSPGISTSRPYNVAQLRVGEAFAGSPCPVHLPDGGTLWLDTTPAALALAQALRQATGGPGWVAGRIGHWPSVAVALVLLVALVAWFNHTGAGLAARAVLPLVPQSVDREVGKRVWASLEPRWVRPTQYAERCRTLAQRFDAAVQAFDDGPALPWLKCRRLQHVAGFNAFALPDGQIVLLDGVLEAFTDDQLMAVLGHELAHVRERHGMQAVMRQMGLLAVTGAALGDFSSVAAASLAGLHGLAYSRNAEREADAQALRFLASAGLPADLWTQVWRRFAEEEARHGGSLPAWISSHPPTEERMRLAAPPASAGMAGAAPAAPPPRPSSPP